MTFALLAAGGLIAFAVMVYSGRRAWRDHHSLEKHHKVLDALGEVAHHQDSAIAPVPDQASVWAHVRVVDQTSPGPPGPGLARARSVPGPGHPGAGRP